MPNDLYDLSNLDSKTAARKRVMALYKLLDKERSSVLSQFVLNPEIKKINDCIKVIKTTFSLEE